VTAREFFEGLPARVGPEQARALGGSYRFDVEGAGTWRLDPQGDRVAVTEEEAPADCVIKTDEQTFLAILAEEQSPMTAYMRGKIRVEGDIGLALRLRELLT
jgi:predicted lipid carrier protein YhbT